jgi:hypothetical protein
MTANNSTSMVLNVMYFMTASASTAQINITTPTSTPTSTLNWSSQS